MSWWILFLIGFAIGAGVAFAVRLLGHEPRERRGTMEFNTPEAREALRDPHDPPPTTRFDSDTLGRRQ